MLSEIVEASAEFSLTVVEVHEQSETQNNPGAS